MRIRVININNSNQARKELNEIGADSPGVNLMIPKAVHRVIRVENVSTKAAIILKQEMLSKGGEAAVSRGVGNLSVDHTSVLLMGTVKQYSKLIRNLKGQPFGLAKLAERLREVIDNCDDTAAKVLDCRGYQLPLGERTLVMGILNITPDSFSDGGKFFDMEAAVKHALEMVEQGIDIIDVGGESTRPKADPVSLEMELERVIPVIERLVKEVKVPISVDTYKAEVARQSLLAGAHMINDIWGLKAEPELAKVVAEHENVPLILMHNQNGTEYDSLMDDILDFLRKSCNLAQEAGVQPKNLIIDPGIGFGKTTDHNLEVMNRLWEFKTLGYPMLLGTSRKSLIGNTLGLLANERVEGTGATVAFGISQGADIVRVHDIKEMIRVVKMTDAMVRR